MKGKGPRQGDAAALRIVESRSIMYRKFVQTSNVSRFLAAAAAIEQRTAPEACLVLVQGDAGHGKSRCGQAWATNQDAAIFLRLKAACTPKWLLSDLVQELGEQAPAHSCEALFNQAIGYLAKDPQPIVVDEVENGLGEIKVLETIRDISDLVSVPVIFLGREYVWGKLQRYKHFKTRIGARADFSALDRADVRKCFDTLCEVEVDDGVIDAVASQSEGRIREIVKAIENVERLGFKANSRVVTGAAVSGEPLIHDWQRSKRKAA